MTPLRAHTLVLPLSFAALLSLGLASGRPAFQEQVPAAQHIAGSVHYIRGEGCGNIALCVGEEGVFMVDAQLLDLAAANRETILALAGLEPTFLLNTHWHGDHTGGNRVFAATATIVAHVNVRRRMARDPDIGGRTATEVVEAALPALTFEDGITFHFNGEEIQVQHYPDAHTDGDSVVWFRDSKVLHTGDLFFELGYPFVDVDSGASIDGLIAAVRSLLETIPPDTHIIPGHGAPTDVDGLREYLAMLETITERVREGLAAGKSAEELVEDELTADFDARWGHFAFVPPARFVSTVARSLAGE